MSSPTLPVLTTPPSSNMSSTPLNNSPSISKQSSTACSGNSSASQPRSVPSRSVRRRSTGVSQKRKGVSRKCSVKICPQTATGAWAKGWKCPYHEKLKAKLLQPVSTYLSEAELHAIIDGRYRGDGRKVDAYVMYDPLFIDLEG